MKQSHLLPSTSPENPQQKNNKPNMHNIPNENLKIQVPWKKHEVFSNMYSP